MRKSGGYWHRILRLNLTTREITEEKLGEDILRKYLGGVGLATKIIFDEVAAGVDPLSSENKLVFATGPFQGSGIPGGGRWIAAAKSPLTGIWGESNAGGYWGKEFKRTGYDALVLEGRAEEPVYLSIENGEAELEDAAQLWGLDTHEVDEAIKKELGDRKVKVACIGPAGEKLVKIACIVCDKGHGVAGRCGLGAVMGSKNLKALAVRGDMNINVANPDKARQITKKIAEDVRNSEFAKYFRKHGQAGYVVPNEELGALPIKNWSVGAWKEGAEKIGAPFYTEELNVKPMGCADCPVACHRYYKVAEPPDYAYEGPGGAQYETLGMLGSNLLIDDLKAVAKANELCNRYGIDTISAGSLIGFAVECHEKGLITKDDTGGLELSWGDPKVLLAMIKRIADREGFGAVLAEGIKNAVHKIGRGSSRFAAHVKGLDLAAIDPRAFFSMAVSIATCTRGACHLHGYSASAELGILLPEVGITEALDRFSWKKKGYIATIFQDHAALQNSLVECLCIPFDAMALSLKEEVELLSSITGWNITIDEAMRIGERINNLQRLFNMLHADMNRKDDTLPQRFCTPLEEGGAAGKVPPLEKMLDEYYEARGWDRAGMQPKHKLRELGLTTDRSL